jgi:hypothetical protein
LGGTLFAKADLAYYMLIQPGLLPGPYWLDGEVEDPLPLVGVTISYETVAAGVILYSPKLNAKGKIIVLSAVAVSAYMAMANALPGIAATAALTGM